ESLEGPAEVLALPEDRQPAQAGLEALEAELFEQPVVVGDGSSPFLVMVARVDFLALAPGATMRFGGGHASHSGLRRKLIPSPVLGTKPLHRRRIYLLSTMSGREALTMRLHRAFGIPRN